LNEIGKSSAGSSRIDSGSYVDSRGFSTVVGLGVSGDSEDISHIVGVFCEFGNGSYDSHNDIPDGRHIHGEGNAGYVGGGLLDSSGG
jgi:hypothetical protein